MSTPPDAGDARESNGRHPAGDEPTGGVDPPRTMPEAAERVRWCLTPRPSDAKRGDPMRDLLRAGIMLGEWKRGHPHYLAVCVSARTLSAEMGTHTQTARGRLIEAERLGLIRVINGGGGRGRAKVWAIDWDAVDRLPRTEKPRARDSRFQRETQAPEARESNGKAPRQTRGNRNRNPRAESKKPPRRDTETPAPETRAPSLHRTTTTRETAAGGGGVSTPEGWTEADHAEALAIARGIGHTDPAGFVRRAGTLERVAYLAEQTKSADNPAGAAEKRLRDGEQPPAEWVRTWRRRREAKRRAEAEQSEANERERQQRETTLCGLSADHLAAVVEHRAAELAHPAGLNAPDRADRLRRIHEAGRLFNDDDDAREALAELVWIGGTLAAFDLAIRKAKPRG